MVKEVVREKRIHFFDVPKLGSYLAVELKYDSCLNESSFDQAYKEYQECIEKHKEQEAEIKEFEEAQQEEKDNKESAGEPYKKPEKKWPEISPPSYRTEESLFVVCLDTMGQDREFTKEEIAFTVETILKYSKSWVDLELKMKFDVEKRYEMH